MGPSDKKRALGKGISALLPSRQQPAPSLPPTPPPPPPSDQNSILQVPVNEIEPSPHQPRHIFDHAKLEELAQSIRENGVIQPLILRRRDNRFELVAGERRLRASKLAGLATVPAVIQDFAPDRLLEVALIENIQREDLNPIELALAYDRLSREIGLTHEQIGQRCGKDRSSVANTIRLLRLPEAVQQMVSEGTLHMGQARALLALENQADMIRIAEKAAAQHLTARQVEALVRFTLEPPRKEEKVESKQDPNIKAAADELERTLGTRVRIVESNENRGRIEIDYFSQDELTRIYDLIVGK
jgi:ParB family transcriptional regulator, chromosome partitioning protein